MEVVAQARAMEGETSVSNKRRRIDSGDPILVQSSLSNDRRSNHRRFSVSDSPENSISPTETPELPLPAGLLCICNKSDIISSRSPDLKADGNCGTESISILNRNGFSTDEKTEKVMESPPSTTKKKTVPARSIPVSKMPSAAEIEEFFSVAEKYEEKRFAEKYNYDIVKDVPLEGRYQWVSLKPST